MPQALKIYRFLLNFISAITDCLPKKEKKLTPPEKRSQYL